MKYPTIKKLARKLRQGKVNPEQMNVVHVAEAIAKTRAKKYKHKRSKQ